MCTRYWTALLSANRFLRRNDFAFLCVLSHVVKSTASVGLLQLEPVEKMDGVGLTVALG